MNLTEIFKGKASETETAPRKATDLLKEDHQKVKSLFQEFRGLEEDAEQEKGRIFEQIRRELTVHAKVEEEIFYPAVRKLPEDEATDLVLEAAEEHAIVKTLLGQLQSLDAGDDVFDAKMKVRWKPSSTTRTRKRATCFPKPGKASTKERSWHSALE